MWTFEQKDSGRTPNEMQLFSKTTEDRKDFQVFKISQTKQKKEIKTRKKYVTVLFIYRTFSKNLITLILRAKQPAGMIRIANRSFSSIRTDETLAQTT